MKRELRNRLLLLAEKYETPEFIQEDPVQIPHRYSDKKDIEVSALITSWIATGNRKAIIKCADRVDLEVFASAPYKYILEKRWEAYRGNKASFYRYYSYHDFYMLCNTLHHVYTTYGCLGDYLFRSYADLSPLQRLQTLLGHVNGMPEPKSGSEAKKMCMFLRWMIRRNSPVDFGIWNEFAPGSLIIPLDTHVHRISLELGLTGSRKCLNTARDITDALREVWPEDPVKGDFALFGYGVNEIRI